MPPLVIPSLAKFMFGALGAAAVVHWAVKEARRINEQLNRAKTAPAVDPMRHEALPILRRDPSTGEWRVQQSVVSNQ
jgi:hypothetical protein